jgi:effector-binding domain-containing protein
MDDAVRIVTTAEMPTAVVAETTSWEEFPGVWRALLAEVWAFLRDSHLRTGRNVMLYMGDSPNVEVGAVVSSSFTGRGRVVPSSLPAGRAASAVARGEPSPARLAGVHTAVRDWCAENGHTLTGTRCEVYGHWLQDQDPALFETEVYWLLEPDPDSPSAAALRSTPMSGRGSRDTREHGP